jgi:uncharacterized membrane protein
MTDHSGGGLAPAMIRYTLARVGLLVLIAAVLILVGVPALVAILIALVASLGLSLVLFRGLRADLDEELAAARARRRSERARLRQALRGEGEEQHADQ